MRAPVPGGSGSGARRRRAPLVAVLAAALATAALVAAALVAAALVAAVLAVGTRTASRDADGSGGVVRLRARVLEVLRHDPKAYTQGLEARGGRLYESTGRFGKSTVAVGAPGEPPAVRVRLPAEFFGEGLTVVGRRVWQLTWRNGVAVERDARTLREIRRVRYPGEGWGICYQPEYDRLVTSDGSAWLTHRDPRTLAATGRVRVVEPGGGPVRSLNELECVGDGVYANVFGRHRIVRVDGDSGRVTADIDASGLLEPGEHGGVLNGIAALPGGEEFLLTGKDWPKMFRVRFDAVAAGG
ncbi:glutaminyl-peptide cyclotransferase [Streptomyces sp. NPDC006997]|uniref:glutaminyl-peptide cyclotransferase n=1 Tax=Streptomyces sp. NPDC006997 TaxID=3155356 RepID=UPI0033C99833